MEVGRRVRRPDVEPLSKQRVPGVSDPGRDRVPSLDRFLLVVVASDRLGALMSGRSRESDDDVVDRTPRFHVLDVFHAAFIFAAWMFVYRDGCDAVRRCRVGGEPSQSVGDRLPVTGGPVQIVEQLLERGELPFELRRDENRHVLLAILGWNVPFDPGEDNQLWAPGSRL